MQEKEDMLDDDDLRKALGETLEGVSSPDIDEDDVEFVAVDERGVEVGSEEEGAACKESDSLQKEIDEVRDEYVRLYAEFENYRKRVNRDKEELRKYANETILYNILPSLDNLEIALSHVVNESGRGGSSDDLVKKLTEGVQMTLRELHRTLEKEGLKRIDAVGKPFNPEVHHAISKVYKDNMDPDMVVEELRTGYMYRDKVLRASMVTVSARLAGSSDESAPAEDSGTDGLET